MITATIVEARDGESEKPPLILVCLRPRSYSETIGQVLGELRPGFAVSIVEPAELGDKVLLLHPDLVLCSQPGTVARDGGRGAPNTSWVEYYPYAEPPEDELRIDGRSSGQRSVELSDLLILLDRALMRV